MFVQKSQLMNISQKIIWNAYDKPRNTCSFIHDEPRWMSDEHQHSDGQNVHPEFQVKVCGAQDTWHNTIGHLTTDIWAKKTYK